MYRKRSTTLLPGLALIISCLNRCGQAVATSDGRPIGVYGHPEHLSDRKEHALTDVPAGHAAMHGYRNVATQLLKKDADGIYLFNVLTSREEGEKAYGPPFGVLRDLNR